MTSRSMPRPAERWKMLCGAPGAVYASPNGIHWTQVCHYITQPLVELYGGCVLVLKEL
jgi:hypothetical protein